MIQNIGQIGSVNALQDDVRRSSGSVKGPSVAQTTSAIDSLEISQEALRLKGESNSVSQSTSVADEMKTQRIRNQIASGFYNTPAVQRAVAMKISQSLLDQ